MKCFINKINRYIYSKRKQILFALFAFLYYFIDTEVADSVLKCAAPAVVAGAAKAAAAVGKTAITAAEKTAEVAGKATVATAEKAVVTAGKAAASAGNNASTVANVATTSSKMPSSTFGSLKNSNLSQSSSINKLSNKINSSKKFNLNPKKGGIANSVGNPLNSGLGTEQNPSNNMNTYYNKYVRNNPLNLLNKDNTSEEDEDDNEMMENASKKVVKSIPSLIIIFFVVGILFFVSLVPAILLSFVNATNTTLSQIDCTKQQGSNCEVEDESDNFFSKLKNLFQYGAYASNSEIVLNEFEDSYDKIKEEYDFIISLNLLSATMFSDAKYIETEIKDGKFSITEDMLDRVEYIYDVALLQLIPEYNIYSCEATLVDSVRNIYEFNETYIETVVPTYDDADTTEEDMKEVTTGVCDSSTAGGIFKKITYVFDEVKYFKRLKNSEELDLVYTDFDEADDLLVSKIANQYYIYKKLYNVDEELNYKNIPSQLYTDSNVLISSPLKGWYSITSPFGYRDGTYEGMHTGIDLVARDKNIYAAGNGVVTRSNVETEGGNVIEITHTDSSGRKYVTQYAHLSTRNVSVGDVVNVGDVIGIMGDTGTMASGVHLHFAMWDEETGIRYNPRQLFEGASNY